VADIRYKYIETICAGVIKHSPLKGPVSPSDKIDVILTNKLFGLPVFFIAMFMVFHLTFSESLIFTGFIRDGGIPSPGLLLQGWMELFTEWATGAMGNLLSSAPP